MSNSLQEGRPIHGKGVKRTRWPGIVFVILFHVLAIWGLASGLANSTIQLLRGNMQTVVTTEELKSTVTVLRYQN